jgi:mercuric ion transport protein
MTRTTKAAVGAIVAAAGASLCCLGPVVLTLVGAGALGAAATRWEPYRPVFLGLAVLLLGAAFYSAYRPGRQACAADGGCPTPVSRTAKIVLWIVTGLVVLLAAFPYYIGWFV